MTTDKLMSTMSRSHAQMFIMEAREADEAALTDGIKRLFNCAEASVDEVGDVWIANPQTGHWLDEDRLVEVALAIEARSI